MIRDIIKFCTKDRQILCNAVLLTFMKQGPSGDKKIQEVLGKREIDQVFTSSQPPCLHSIGFTGNSSLEKNVLEKITIAERVQIDQLRVNLRTRKSYFYPRAFRTKYYNIVGA